MAANVQSSPAVAAFRRRCYPQISDADWDRWQWQLNHRIRDLDGLERVVELTAGEREAARRRRGGPLPVGVTPYYAALFAAGGPDHPLRKTMVPRPEEFTVSPGEREDPLGEEAHLAAPGLVHTYPAKALLLVTGFCASYCRYCTRARMVGAGGVRPGRAQWEQALQYLREHPEIEDVLVSGGEPLVLSDARLAWLLERLSAIPHVRLIRIGTKIPAVLPQRITPALAQLLARFHPLWLSIHFTHPDELTPEAAAACGRLADAGIPLMGQTVLLKGVNDDPDTLARLFTGLVRLRVKPYYLHQCDSITGSAQFKTPVDRGLALVAGLQGRLTGYAIPHLMIDAPGGGGKVPVSPDFVAGRDGDDLLLRSYRGEIYRYPDPGGTCGQPRPPAGPRAG